MTRIKESPEDEYRRLKGYGPDHPVPLSLKSPTVPDDEARNLDMQRSATSRTASSAKTAPLFPPVSIGRAATALGKDLVKGAHAVSERVTDLAGDTRRGLEDGWDALKRHGAELRKSRVQRIIDSVETEPPLPAVIKPPSLGWSQAKIDKTLDASARREALREKDFFSVPPADKRIELFMKSVPGARNDVKAHVKGAEASGNFVFGAEAAAAGLSEREALLWAQGAQVFQDAKNGRWPSGSDNPGDAQRVREGYHYFQRRTSSNQER